MCLIQKIIDGEGVLIRGGVLIERRLVQNGSKGGRLFARGRLIEDLQYIYIYNKY